MTARSFLRFGSRVLPDVVVDGVACVQELEYGAQLLQDPGFELNRVGGAGGDEIPWGYVSVADCTWRMQFANGTCAPSNDFYWVGQQTGVSDEPFVVSTANPRSGTFHGRRAQDASSAFLYPRKQQYCNEASLYEHIPLSVVIDDGDTLDFSIWVAATAGSDNPRAQVGVFWVWEDETNDTFEAGSIVNLSTSYSEVTFSGVAPVFTGTAIIQIELICDAQSATEFWDVDDATLGVTAA